MIKDQQNGVGVRRPAAYTCAALALALGVSVLAGTGQATELPSPAGAPGLSALLATSSDVLSEDAMAQQKGSGLRSGPVIGNEPGASPRVLLWDEMKITPIPNPLNDGVITNGTGAR